MAKKVLRNDWDEFQKGDYCVVNNVWNKGDRISGKDYTQTVTLDTADLSRDVRFEWDWGPNAGHVLAYPEVIVGYKPWGRTGTDAISGRVSDIRSFDVTHNLAIGGRDTDLFNVAYDLWLSEKPLAGAASITTELMVWAHSGKLGDFGSSAFFGTYRHGDFKADIYTYDDFGASGAGGHTWRYLALVPRGDMLKANIDLHDILIDMVERGLVSEKDYVNGYELGAEVTGGKGRLDIRRLTHDYDTYDADAGSNLLNGTGDRDRLHGLGGDDSLKGAGGNDFLDGGAGSDTLAGGAGKDVFFFNAPRGEADVISDFVHGVDRIALDATAFAAIGARLTAGEFGTGAEFDAETRILYKSETGEVFYDADGSGADDSAHLLATLTNTAAIDHSDFVMI